MTQMGTDALHFSNHGRAVNGWIRLGHHALMTPPATYFHSRKIKQETVAGRLIIGRVGRSILRDK